MMRIAHRTGYTLVEAVVTLLLVVALVAILLPVMSRMHWGHSHGHGQMYNNSQLRGIHQAMVMYSQSNKTYYPGINPKGAVADATTEGRFQLLLEGNYFTGEYAISPFETKTAWTTGALTSANYSYAMLDIDAGPGGRLTEWSDTLNTEAVALSDRNTGSDATANAQSIHTDTAGDWRGGVAWNDNHVIFETEHVLQTGYTVLDSDGKSSIMNHSADNLFASDSTDDALMIHSGK